MHILFKNFNAIIKTEFKKTEEKNLIPSSLFRVFCKNLAFLKKVDPCRKQPLIQVWLLKDLKNSMHYYEVILRTSDI